MSSRASRVEENLVLVFRQRAGRGSVATNLTRAYEAFPILGERRKQAAGTLSGGQQRLLSLAKVLVVPPKLLVADELSLGLAPVVVDAVYEGLEAIDRNGTAMLVVEQQIDRVLKLAGKALVLDRGRVAYDGTPDGAATVIDRLLSRTRRGGGSGSGTGRRDRGRCKCDPDSRRGRGRPERRGPRSPARRSANAPGDPKSEQLTGSADYRDGGSGSRDSQIVGASREEFS